MAVEDLPVRLQNDPILEAVFELRFEPAKPELAEVLPGLLYGALGSHYQDVVSLPASSVPDPIRRTDKEFEYSALVALRGELSSISIGDRVIGLAHKRPYPGWPAFRREISRLLDAVRETNVVKKAVRASLKYVNVVPEATVSTEEPLLNVGVQLGELQYDEKTLRVRTEVHSEDLGTIIEIIGSVVASSGDDYQAEGTLVSVDTYTKAIDGNFVTSYERVLDEIHSEEKRVFFSLLTQQTMKNLGAEWEQKSV